MAERSATTITTSSSDWARMFDFGDEVNLLRKAAMMKEVEEQEKNGGCEADYKQRQGKKVNVVGSLS